MRRILFAIVACALGVPGARADEVRQIPRAEVDAAFARGAPLFETESYKVHASRRDAPGMAEIHELDTDVLYVREGRATFVTGGSVVDPREVAAHEIRGSAIANGTAREIGPGDVVTVPHGTPHWFQAVRGPLVYYVVKVTDGGRGPEMVPGGAPLATVDLATREGAARVQGTWRYRDAALVAAKHRAPDAAGQPTGKPVSTWQIEPRAGWADYDDSRWPAIAADSLGARRGNGRLSFGWYRIAVTVPDRVGDVETAGKTLVFEATVDDYAEVWVDGEIARGLDQRGGAVVAGWNAPNRVVIARDARPGQKIQLALFGANGPLSDPPANFVWVRTARLEVYPGEVGPRAIGPQEVNVEVQRKDAALDAIVPANPKLFKLAEGFSFTEGPVWVKDGGFLLFSDPNANRIYRYDPNGNGALSVFRERSGYDGADIAEFGQPGSNGLALDAEGRLVIAEHGRHQISRLDTIAASAEPQVLVDSFDGRRLNSPNDLVYRSDGTLFFTDPPFGLPRFFADPRKELPWSGVYSLNGHGLVLAAKELSGPNGVAFSPDEKFLYVTNWDEKKKIVMRYEAQLDGTLRNGRVFFDMTSAPGEEALDGLKVDERGNLYVSGPGGLWIIDARGRHLGTVRGPRLAANFAWGDADGRTLYWTARSALYRMRFDVAGAHR